MKSYGNRMEYAGASFTNSDSADLAEIANGNRMEYTGASFANSDSADLAEIAYGNRMGIVWRSRMEIAYGNRIYRRKFRKFRFSGSFGNRI